MKITDSLGNDHNISLNDNISQSLADYPGDGYNNKSDIPMPKAGTFKNLFVKVHEFTTDEPESQMQFKLYVNGQESSIGVNIEGVGLVSDTSNQMTVVAGDMVSFGINRVGDSSGTYKLSGSVEFEEA